MTENTDTAAIVASVSAAAGSDARLADAAATMGPEEFAEFLLAELPRLVEEAVERLVRGVNVAVDRLIGADCYEASEYSYRAHMDMFARRIYRAIHAAA